MPASPLILLASASRAAVNCCDQVGIPHEIRPVGIDESIQPDEAPSAYVVRLAETKARTLWGTLPPVARLPVLAADTTVALEGEIFGKPRDAGDARAMLGRLSGQTHQVHTAVAVLHAGGAATRVCSSDVSMRTMTPAEIDWYWSTGEPGDKAGAYAVQGRAAVFIRHIAGSYSGVMGLPLYETWELLAPVLGLMPGSRA